MAPAHLTGPDALQPFQQDISDIVKPQWEWIRRFRDEDVRMALKNILPSESDTLACVGSWSRIGTGFMSLESSR